MMPPPPSALLARIELCARLARCVHGGGDSDQAMPPPAGPLLEDVVATYVAIASESPTTPDAFSNVPGSVGSGPDVDDMVLASVLRILQRALAEVDAATLERSFLAARAVVDAAVDPRAPRIMAFLQNAVVALPPPPSTTTAAGTASGTLTLATQSEELRLAILSCLAAVLRSAAAPYALWSLLHGSPTTGASMSTTEAMHFVAYVISCLLHIAESDRCRPAALAAIEALVLLIARIADAEHRDHDSPDQKSTLLRQFFPGIVLGMCKAATAPLQASSVAVAAIRCLAQMLQRCLADPDSSTTTAFTIDSLRALTSSPRPPSPTADRVADDGGATDASHRSSEDPTADAWLTTAATNVDVLLSRLLGTKLDGKTWRVRVAVVELCRVVVVKCRGALRDSFFRCFEELMVLRTHAIEDVAKAAGDALEQLQSSLPTGEWLTLEPQFTERFLMRLSALALQCTTDHESVSVHAMEILIGYMHFLGPRFRGSMDEHLISILKTFVRVVAFDTLDIDLIQHETIRTPDESMNATGADSVVHLPRFQRRFRHFHEDVSVSTMTRLLRCVGQNATLALAIDTIFELLQDESTVAAPAPEMVVILNEILRAQVPQAKEVPPRGLTHLIGRVLEDLLDLPQWQVQSKPMANTTALLVECIGICAEVLRSDFAEFLMYVLYPLVEKLGSPHQEVERTALAALHKVAFYCGYGVSLQSLFEANMDYFVDALCARLEHLDVYPQTPGVVEGLLRHSSIASLPLVDEITASLLRSVDRHQDADSIRVLLQSLHLLLTSFKDTKSSPVEPQPAISNDLHEEPSFLSHFLDEIRAWTEPPVSSEDPKPHDQDSGATEPEISVKGAMPIEHGESDPSAGDGEDDADNEPKLPFESQVIQILERGSYFVADPDPMVCCLVLSTIGDGIEYLAPRRRELLPLIHRLWPSLLHRFRVTNRPILTGSVKLLTTISRVAGDFIGDRFIETVWPPIRTLLASLDADDNASITSAGVPTLTRSMLLLKTDDDDAIGQGKHQNDQAPPTGRKSLDLRLLHAILHFLGVVCEHAPTVISLVPEMTAVCSRFLDSRYADDTRALAITALERMATLNGDEVFYAMAILGQWQPPSPPTARFPAYEPSVGSKWDGAAGDMHRRKYFALSVVERLK